MGGPPVVAFEVRFFIGAESGGGDFTELVAEQIELLGVRVLVHNQRRFFGFERGAAADESGKAFAQRVQAAEGVENGELIGGVEE